MLEFLKSKICYLPLLSLSLVFALIPSNQAQAKVDLGIQSSDVSFSTNSFVAGQKATVYVKVRSYGDEDASGIINLYLNNELLAAGLAVSVVASEPDTVYAEFTVPTKNFKIWADLKAVMPADSQQSNNNVITVEQTIDIDTDSDGIGDTKDNDDDNDGLSDTEEARLGTNSKKVDTDNDGYGDSNDAFPLDKGEWFDTDHDGVGDNADSDDDNDGLSDADEARLGTNPKKADTDGDGYNDKDDYYPLDAKKHLKEAAPVKPTEPAITPTPGTPAPATPPKETPPATTGTASGTEGVDSVSSVTSEQAAEHLEEIEKDLNKIKTGEPLDGDSSIFHLNQPGFWFLIIGLLIVMMILLKVRSRAGKVSKKTSKISQDDFAIPPSAQLRQEIEASLNTPESEVVRPTVKSSKKIVTVKVKKVTTKR